MSFDEDIPRRPSVAPKPGFAEMMAKLHRLPPERRSYLDELGDAAAASYEMYVRDVLRPGGGALPPQTGPAAPASVVPLGQLPVTHSASHWLRAKLRRFRSYLSDTGQEAPARIQPIRNDFRGAVLPVPVTAPQEFVHRQAELARLARMMRERRPRVAVVTGPSGVGKSTLLGHLFLRFHDEFPGGGLYADLGAKSAGWPISVSDVLNKFLISLGVSKQEVPASLTERAAVFRRLTEHRSVLVILDNVHPTTKVTALQPGKRGMLVVASRSRLRELLYAGAAEIPMRPLDPGDSMTLLTGFVEAERLSDEPDGAEELVRFCGGLPSALRLAGMQLRACPSLSVSGLMRVLTELVAAEPCPATAEALLDYTYQELPVEAARLYRYVGLLPTASFTVSSAVALAQRTRSEVEESLSVLVRHGLVERLANDRLRLHQLACSHARQLAERDDTGDDRKAARRRIVDWYLGQATAADSAVMPGRLRLTTGDDLLDPPAGFPDRSAAFEWLELEHENLVAMVAIATQEGWHERVWQLCESLWGFFILGKHYDNWFTTCRLGVNAARLAADARAEARMLCQLGRAHFELNELDEAQDHFSLAIQSARSSEDWLSEAFATESLGLTLMAAEQFDEALEFFGRTARIAEALPEHQRLLALSRYHCGRALNGAGRPGEAVTQLRAAHEILVELGEPRCATKVLTVLSQSYVAMGEFDTAVATLSAALTTIRAAGHKRQEAEVLEALADVADRTGNRRLAHRCLSELLNSKELEAAERAQHRLRLLFSNQPQDAGEGSGNGGPAIDRWEICVGY